MKGKARKGGSQPKEEADRKQFHWLEHVLFEQNISFYLGTCKTQF